MERLKSTFSVRFGSIFEPNRAERAERTVPGESAPKSALILFINPKNYNINFLVANRNAASQFIQGIVNVTRT